jgi:hypothetical protein
MFTAGWEGNDHGRPGVDPGVRDKDEKRNARDANADDHSRGPVGC